MIKKSDVYTKTGDKGTTSLVGGARVPKNHLRLEAYGTIDELNTFIGSLICQVSEDSKSTLQLIQHRLFAVGSYLATETEAVSPKAASIISDEDIKGIELQIDEMDNQLPKLSRFILPGGSEAAARAHICRTVCRRAERCIYRVKKHYPVDNNILMYINRLSDYFFLLARKECNKNGKEIFWEQNV